MAMLWLVFMIVALLPASQGQMKILGGTSCVAYYNKYGDMCYSDTSSQTRPGATLKYLISVNGNGEICCKAYMCTRYSCSMSSIGCGRKNWSSADLQWVGDNLETPKMQCKAAGHPYRTIYYSFKTTH